MLFSKCLRAKIYCNMNVHFDPQGCQTLLLKESELFFLSLGSWTMMKLHRKHSITRRCVMHKIKVPTRKVKATVEPEIKFCLKLCLSNNSKITEANLLKLHITIMLLFYSILSHNLGRSSGHHR